MSAPAGNKSTGNRSSPVGGTRAPTRACAGDRGRRAPSARRPISVAWRATVDLWDELLARTRPPGEWDQRRSENGPQRALGGAVRVQRACSSMCSPKDNSSSRATTFGRGFWPSANTASTAHCARKPQLSRSRTRRWTPRRGDYGLRASAPQPELSDKHRQGTSSARNSGDSEPLRSEKCQRDVALRAHVLAVSV